MSDLQQTPVTRAERRGPLQPQQRLRTDPPHSVPAVCTCICPRVFLHPRTCMCVCASTRFCACEPLVRVCTHLRTHVSALPARCPEGPQLCRGGGVPTQPLRSVQPGPRKAVTAPPCRCELR